MVMVFTLGVVITGCAAKEETAKEEETASAEETVLPTETAEETPVGEQEVEAPIPTPAPIVPPKFDEMDLSKMVKLTQYKGMELEKAIKPVTEEEVDAEVKSALANAPVEDKEGVVDEGDTANINFVGKIDGVAFEGGTMENYDLTIGSSSLVPGFEEQLIGAKKGETRDIDIKFADDYNPDVAGKDAVFTVTINEVKSVLDKPTDEWLAANTEFKTLDEYKESINKSLTDYNQQAAEEELTSQAWKKLMDDSEVIECPQEVLDYARKMYDQSIQQYADYSQQTIEEFVTSQGMTMEDYNKEAEESAANVAKQVLVMNAIGQVESMKPGEKIYDDAFAKVVEESQMTQEELIEEIGAENLAQNVVVRCVQQFVMDNAKIKEVEVSDSETAEEELPEGHSADDGHDH